VPLPVFQPLPLTRQPEPFSHPDWLFEVKYDGFRALAYCDPSGVRLVSRKGIRFSSFTELCAGIEVRAEGQAHRNFDGEIVCLDEGGCSQSGRISPIVLFRNKATVVSQFRYRMPAS